MDETRDVIGTTTPSERQWAACAHLAALVLALCTSWMAGIAGVLGAGAVYMFKRDDSAFVAAHARVASYAIGPGFDPSRYRETSNADWAVLTVTEVDFGAFRSLSATIAMAIALAVAVGSARE